MSENLSVEMDLTAILAVVEQDLRLIQRLQDLAADYGLTLHLTRSAHEAILYLRGIGIYSNRIRYPLPGLVLLDTENGEASDLELLSWIRENEQFRPLPVGLLASEPPHKLHVTCAIDPECFIVERDSLWELPGLAWEVFFQKTAV